MIVPHEVTYRGFPPFFSGDFFFDVFFQEKMAGFRGICRRVLERGLMNFHEYSWDLSELAYQLIRVLYEYFSYQTYEDIMDEVMIV